MRPSIIYELLSDSAALNSVGINGNRIRESQSLDARPFDTGYFITISADEVEFSRTSTLQKGPRNFTFAVHVNAETTRNYDIIDYILSAIKNILTSISDVKGADGCRVSQVRARGRSGNLLDEGWNTITRNATFGVLYDELAG